MKQPPSMPDWVSKAICRKCKKKGHLSFNYPPKHDNKPFKSKYPNKRNSVHFKESAACVSQFAGSLIIITEMLCGKYATRSLVTHNITFKR